jgi:hypothetical protein
MNATSEAVILSFLFALSQQDTPEIPAELASLATASLDDSQKVNKLHELALGSPFLQEEYERCYKYLVSPTVIRSMGFKTAPNEDTTPPRENSEIDNILRSPEQAIKRMQQTIDKINEGLSAQ